MIRWTRAEPVGLLTITAVAQLSPAGALRLDRFFNRVPSLEAYYRLSTVGRGITIRGGPGGILNFE
jgi:hypothetical protein